MIGASEYERRLERLRSRMSQYRLDAVVITAEANFRYFTGYAPHLYVSPTRPWFAVLPQLSPPVGVIPELALADMRRESWFAHYRTWSSPCPLDEGVTELAAALNAIRRRNGRIGFELGPESRLGMPAADFARLKELVQAEFVDVAPALQALRSRKSAGEIALVRAAIDAAHYAFEALPVMLRTGSSERDLYREFQIAALQGGADRVPYVAIGTGSGGYDSLVRSPTERPLARYDIVGVDTGTVVGGYWADFNRNFAIEAASVEAQSAYARLWEAQRRALGVLRPGVHASTIWAVMYQVLSEGPGADTSPVGRFGHGIGLDYTEPPSICASDHTVLEPGMVVTLEPSLMYSLPDSMGGGHPIMALEEDVLVSESGPVLLTPRAPEQLPIA